MLLIGAIVVGFSILNKPSEEKKEEMLRKRDSLQQVENERIKKEKIEQELIEQVSAKKAEAIDTSGLKAQAGVFANSMLGAEEYYTLENDLLQLKISSKGGRPYSVALKNYKTHFIYKE